MEDNYSLLRYVQNGFDRIRADQGMARQGDLSKGLAGRIEAHFTSVNRGIALRKAGQFLEGLETPEEDQEEYTARQRRLAEGRERSYTTTHDEGLEDVPEDTGVPAYGEAPHPDDEPFWVPGALRVNAIQESIIRAGVADSQARINEETQRNMQQARRQQPRSRRSE